MQNLFFLIKTEILAAAFKKVGTHTRTHGTILGFH